MITDPSWLYSTIAQSSAAIVAIIGGFITSRVLALLAEKRGLVNQLGEKKGALEVLQNKYDELTKGSVHWNTWRKTEKTASEKEIDTLKAEIHNLETRLETFSYPPHLGWGVFILIYLVLSSILFPVGFILTETFSLTSKLFVFVMFALGLVALFAYIGVQVNELRRK